MIDQELDIVKNSIINGVENLLPDEVLVNFLSSKSKMVRSKLGLLYAKTVNASNFNDIYTLLAVTEIIHNASLLHDDVIDNAEIRRGLTTIGKKFASGVSILCGDYLVSIAINKLLNFHNDKLTELFNNCVQNMVKAEIKQFLIRGKIPELTEYIKICEGKTSELFKAMLKSVAIITNTSTNNAEKLGKLFGIYFQIKNDMDKYSEQEDKKNGIYTITDILGVEKAVVLLDNYRKEVIACLQRLPNNMYRDELEGLINNYDR